MRPFLLALVWLAPLPAHALDCIAQGGATVAVWCARGPSFSEATLSASRDDGITWDVLAADVEDACVSETGEVFSIANAPSPTLVAHRTGGAQPIPVETAYGVRSLGTALYVLGSRETDVGPRAFVLRTTDEGAHWQELTSFPMTGALTQFEIGERRGAPRVRALTSEGLSCFGTVRERLYAFDDGVLSSSLLLEEEACANHGEHCANLDVLGLGAHGTAYGAVRHGDVDDMRLAAIAPIERVTPTTLHSEGPMLVAHNASITLAVVGDQLVRLDGATHRVLDRGVPAGTEMLYVDARGRAWVMAGSQLFRFSRGHGFSLIASFP
jgi:hypothetical protein